MIEDEMVRWHHQLTGHEFEQAPGVSNRQGSLVCCSPWSLKELDTVEWLNWTDEYVIKILQSQDKTWTDEELLVAFWDGIYSWWRSCEDCSLLLICLLVDGNILLPARHGCMMLLTQWTWVWANSGDSEGQGSLACYSSLHCRELDIT